MTTLIDEKGLQHYANKMVRVENRRCGNKSLSSALAETNTMIESMKGEFEKIYGEPIEGTFTNETSTFNPGSGIEGDRRDTLENGFIGFRDVLGNTKYKRKDESLTDVWEEGVSLESTGEKEKNLINVKSCGKNLFNIKWYVEGKAGQYFKKYKNGFEIENTNYSKGFGFSKIKGIFKKETQYTLSYKKDSNVGNSRLSVIYTDGVKDVCFNTLTTKQGKTIKEIIFDYGSFSEVGFTRFYNIQLEENLSPTTYEPYQEDTKQIQLPHPLRKVGDVADRIYEKDGKVWLEQNIGEIVLNGSERWGKEYNPDRSYIYYYCQSMNNNYAFLLNKFPFKNKGEGEGTLLPFATFSGSGFFELGFPNGHDLYNDLPTFKKWLSENPTTVLYQLATPITTKISDSPITLECWKNGNIAIENEVVGKTVHTAPLNKPAQIVKNIEELTHLRRRVEKLEELYDKTSLEQTRELALLEQQINLKGEDLND